MFHVCQSFDLIVGQEQAKAKKHLRVAKKKVPLAMLGKAVAAPHLCRKGDSYLGHHCKGSVERAGEVPSCM